MNNVSHKKGWNSGTTQAHVESLPIPLTKGTYDGKLDKYFLRLKLRRYTKSSTSDLYEFRMSLFDNGDPEEFLLFVRNFNMTLAASRILDTGANIQYLCTIVRGEALRQFDLLFSDVESTETLNIEYIIKGLALCYPPLNSLSKKKSAMRRGMKKLSSIKWRACET